MVNMRLLRDSRQLGKAGAVPRSRSPLPAQQQQLHHCPAAAALRRQLLCCSMDPRPALPGRQRRTIISIPVCANETPLQAARQPAAAASQQAASSPSPFQSSRGAAACILFAPAAPKPAPAGPESGRSLTRACQARAVQITRARSASSQSSRAAEPAAGCPAAVGADGMREERPLSRLVPAQRRAPVRRSRVVASCRSARARLRCVKRQRRERHRLGARGPARLAA